ncbi:MAG: hypothetical protein R2877_05200 [Bdellovibrionota bacterium]
MKNMMIQRIAVLASLLFMVNCGLQVRSNPAIISNPNPATAEKVYSISAVAIGVRYEADDPNVPTGYYPNLPESITLSLNGEPFVLDHNGVFTFDQKLKSGEDFEVSVLTNGIEVPNVDGITPSVYLNCAIANPTGTIIDQDITVDLDEEDIVVRCYLADAPFNG